jgi:hypothetical protein
VIFGRSDGIFHIDEQDGRISIALGSSLDYEKETLHKLIVLATDCKLCDNNVKRLSAYTTVLINVTDYNDQ